jgi:hypothetical protein
MAVTMREKTKLRCGPHLPPRTRAGRKLFCEIAGTVTVGGYSDGPIPWPYAKHPGHPLILCGDLVRAVQREAGIAVAFHWGVYKTTASAPGKASVFSLDSEGGSSPDRVSASS